jgi:hypothetical protein
MLARRAGALASRGTLGAAAVVVAVIVVLVIIIISGRGRPPKLPPPPASPRPAPSARAIPRGAGVTMLARVLASSPRYASPGHREPGMVPATWYQRPSVLPVLAVRPGWVRVLAQRPAGVAAWIPAADVRLASTPYRIVINVERTRLTLYDRGRKVFSAPAGVGSPSDPTPTGHYFAAFFEQSVGPGYGPFVIVTSARSRAISNWDGTGDAAIGIHGPLGASQAIAAGGARISHGCIRLELGALHRLRDIPPGTPIDINR